MKSKPILCLDFDGVLHSYTSGWKGAEVISDPPVEGAKEFLQEVVEHFHVNVLSSRSHQPGGRNAMFKWCAKHFTLELTEHLRFPEHKPAAFITIDDRAVQFNGTWPSIDYIRNFKPWNKRT